MVPGCSPLLLLTVDTRSWYYNSTRHHERRATLDTLQELLRQLKAAREAKGLSLSDLTGLTGMDSSALSKLETGQRANPTVETLVRYAEAVGKRLVVSLTDA